MKLKLSRQLLKCIYTEKLKYELNEDVELSMSEFIEECLMDHLNINLVDLDKEKVDLDITFGKSFEEEVNDVASVINTDDLSDCDIKFDNYVYVYMNPLKKLDSEVIVNIDSEEFIFDHEPFYIGKGKGNRLFKHLELLENDKNENKKNIIRDIYEKGLEPIIKIFKNELSSMEAHCLENILISRLDNLSNIKGGKSNQISYIKEGNKNYLEYDKNKILKNLIESGKKNSEISEIMNISVRTIYRMKKNIKEKV